MHDPNSLLMKQLLNNEEKLLKNEIRQENKVLKELIDEKYIEIDDFGRKEYMNVAQLGIIDGAFYITENTSQLKVLSKDVALLMYEAVKVKKNLRTKANCSSIWVRNNEKWKVVFNQRTTIC